VLENVGFQALFVLHKIKMGQKWGKLYYFNIHYKLSVSLF